MATSTVNEMMEEWFEIPLSDVRLSEGDRRGVLRQHFAVDQECREVWDEGTMAIVEKWIRLPEPICSTCGAPWGKYGCAIARSVLLVGILEREHYKQARRVHELTEALTPRFGVERLRHHGNRSIELRFQIDEYTLLRGRMPFVHAVLEKLGRYYVEWFKREGDKARMEQDHAYALAMDVQYANQLRAWTGGDDWVKPPDLPWPDRAPWEF